MRKFGLLLLLITGGCGGPLGPFAGGKLSGSPADYPNSWAIADTAEQVQLETLDTDGNAHSVNVWCVRYADRLFLPTSLVRGEEQPAARSWVENANRHQDVRLRIDGLIYPGALQRVEDPALLSDVKRAFMLKYDAQPDQRSAAAWVFEFVET